MGILKIESEAMSLRDFDYNQNLDSLRDYEISNSTLYYTDERRQRYGVTLLLDLDTPDSGTINLNNSF